MRRWLLVIVIGLLWAAAPVAAEADTPTPAECVYAIPGIRQLGAAGQSIAYSQGILCVPNGDAASDPVIEWGDGTTSVGTITSQKPGYIVVTGAHIYTSPVTFKVRAMVTDVVSGRTYSGGSEREVDIRPAPVPATPAPSKAPASGPDPPRSKSVSAVGYDFKVRRGSPIRGREVALIRTGTPSTDLRATISWGDGTKSRGAIAGIGTLRVTGRHRWRHPGRYAIIVTLTDASGHVVARVTGRAVVVPGK
jgi:hypothetical protein